MIEGAQMEELPSIVFTQLKSSVRRVQDLKACLDYGNFVVVFLDKASNGYPKFVIWTSAPRHSI